jgi:hypothetical protein
VQDVFKGLLTLDVRSVIHAVCTSLVVITSCPVNKHFKDHLKQFYSIWLLEKGRVLTPPEQ